MRYDPNEFIPCAHSPFDDEDEVLDEREIILSDPRKIYDFLRARVYKQDEACKQAALILYNHVNQRASRNVFCGPSGCGKTFIWDIIKNELFDNVTIVDASQMSKSGFSGSVKPVCALENVNSRMGDWIVVLDEVDKMIAPAYERYGSNVSEGIQAEFLALMQPSMPYIYIHNKDNTRVKVQGLTWILCGSFAKAAEQIADRKKTSGLGFGAEKVDAQAFESELTIKDIVNFGMIPELASRMNRIVNLRPLKIEDYIHLICDFENSPVRRLEENYGFEAGFLQQNILSKQDLTDIAIEAYESGLGVRAAYSAVQRAIDNFMFDNFDTFTR